MRRIVVSVLLAASIATVVLAGTARGEKAQQVGGTPSPTATMAPPAGPPPVNTPVFQPPPPPGATNTPTLTPTVTPAPTDTATPIPPTLRVSLAHRTVAPGSTQKVTVVTLPRAHVNITVTFPNGDHKRASKSGNPSGHYSWSYKQPGSRITRTSRTGSVAVNITSGGLSKGASKRYRIGFGAVDVAVQPRVTNRGRIVAFWVHSSARTKVTVVLRFANGGRKSLLSRTGPGGWTYLSYKIPSSVPTGPVAVTGFARGHASGTSFHIQ